MNYFRIIYKTIIDALFPLSKEEHDLLSLSPEETLMHLPPAPPYDASVVIMPNTSSILAYQDKRVSRLVWNIKYKKDAHSLAIAASVMYKKLKLFEESAGKTSRMSADKLILIPMPSAPRRRRERGYNQCELLVNAIKVLDAENLMVVETDLLFRTQYTSHQKMKGRMERLESSKNLFEVKENATNISNVASVTANKRIAYLNELIIVIDDVITTGSTMKEALECLQTAGFKNVGGLSLAH